MSLSRMLCHPETGVVIDFTHAPSEPHLGIEQALEAMAAIEGGAVANLDEKRQVGHYWLRDPGLAPEVEIKAAIEACHAQINNLKLPSADTVVMVGIGGSALGPQLVDDCLRQTDTPRVIFLDNTDPDGHARLLATVDCEKTLFVVISKSGGTVETKNAMLAAQLVCEAQGLRLRDRAIAITGEGSALHGLAQDWLMTFPMWDWVGGRTSVTGPVGLVMMKLCGYDIDGFLQGARLMDAWTRGPAEHNPAAQLAMSWFAAGDGVGNRALVIEPYRDRLALLARYLQQLVMESIGKAVDRQGLQVNQGLTVYGNKGSTDQHAYVQQLRDGRDDAFVHFVTALDPGEAHLDGERVATDTLVGLQLGTEAALTAAGRPSLSIVLPDTSALSLGMVIALFERAVGLYAELVDINAYHQPGVEAGKKAAQGALEVLNRLHWALSEEPLDSVTLAQAVDADPRLSWRLLHHLAATGRAGVERGPDPSLDRFRSPQS